MKRVINYPGSIPRASDLLNTNRNVMVGLAALSEDVFGRDTIAGGFDCTPNASAVTSVTIGPGRIYALANVDGTAYSSLAADTAHQILKQGILQDSVSLSCPAPPGAGQSISYLIQAKFQEVDVDPVVLPYYNSSNPAQAYSGPNNTGSSNNTTRACQALLSAKAGTAASTGSQSIPAPDSGSIGLWTVTVDAGQITILSSDIAAYGSARLADSLLGQLQHALVVLASARADTVYYQGVPTSGSVSTFSRTFTFTTPCDGYVFAIQACNFASQQPGNIQNFVSIKTSETDIAVNSDQSLFPMTNIITKRVNAGQTVTVTGTVQSNGASGSWTNTGTTLSYDFKPIV